MVTLEETAPEQRSFFNRIRSRFSGSSIRKAVGESGILMSLVGNRGNTSVKRDVPAYLKAFNELPWLRTSITKTANSISANDWDILTVTEAHQKDGTMTVTEVEPNSPLPIHAFLNDPNPDLSFQQLVWLTQIYLELVGEGFWWMTLIAGELKAYPIPPDKVIQTPTTEEPYFLIGGPQGQFQIDPKEIIYFTHPDPCDPYARGVGLAQSLSRDLDTDDAASRYVLSHFNNDARPPLLIYGEGLNAERVKQLEDDWNQEHRGFWNAGKARFLSRKVEVKELSQKFEGGDIVTLRQHERDIVLSVMGVPPEIMGVLSASNRATIDAADLFFSRYTLKPRLDFLQEIFNKQLIPLFDTTGNVVMKFVNPVAKDMEAILKAARYMPSALKINEWRELMGYDKLEDDEGDCFILPMNMQVMKKLASAAALGTAPAAPEATPLSPAAQAALAAQAAEGNAAQAATGAGGKPSGGAGSGAAGAGAGAGAEAYGATPPPNAKTAAVQAASDAYLETLRTYERMDADEAALTAAKAAKETAELKTPHGTLKGRKVSSFKE
jgi:HK97 family phage portal protein